MLDSGAGVSCISEKMAADLGAHFEGTRIVYPMTKTAKARVADGRELAIKNQTRRMNVTILTPWAPVEVTLSLAVLPGIDDVLIIGSKSMRERLGVEIMASLKDSIVRKTSDRSISPDEMAEVAVATKEAQTVQSRLSKLGPVGVTLEGMRAAGDRMALPEAQDDIREALIARGPAMFMHPAEESEARIEALHKALETAVLVGMDPEAVKRLCQVVLDTRVDAFRRALTGEPAADVEPLRITLKPDASMERVRARPR